MRIRRKLLEDVFTVVVLFLATGAFQTLVVDPTDLRAATDGSPFMQLLWLFVYVAVVFRLIPRYRQFMMLIRDNKYLVLLVLLAISSIVWSEDPALTLRRSVALLATTLIGVDFALRHSVREQLRLLCIVLGLAVGLGVLAQLISPTMIPSWDFDQEAWHGVLGLKNDWARIVVLGIVAILSRSSRSRRDILLIAPLSLGALGLVVLARYMGALVILVLMLLLFSVFGALRWRPKTLIIAGLASALIAVPISYLFIQNFDKVTAVLGRDATLTGRVSIWQLTLSSIAEKPIRGYGYSAFWEAESQTALRIREEMKWATPHAHNGYIDLTLALGFAGLLLFVASYLTAARRAISCYRSGIEHDSVWPLVYLSFFCLYQFIEGTLVAGNTIFWILYVATCFSITEATGKHQVMLRIDSKFLTPIQVFPFDQERA